MKKKCLLLPLLLLVTVFTTCTKSNKEEIKVKEAPHTNIQAADALSKDLRLLFNVVDQYILNNKSDEALFYANELITEAKKVGDKSAEAIGYYMKGYVYDVQKKEYVQALDCFFKALTIQRELNQWQEIGKSYLGMGNTYYKLQFFDRAKQ
jgi:tetratricopeptide (TPR) repeat protein